MYFSGKNTPSESPLKTLSALWISSPGDEINPRVQQTALFPCSQLASGGAAGSWARFLCCSPSRAGCLLEGCKAPILCPVPHRDAAKGAELNVNLCLTQAWPFFYPHTQQAAFLQRARPRCPASAALEKVCRNSWCSALHPSVPSLLSCCVPSSGDRDRFLPVLCAGSSVCTQGCAA